MLKRFNKANIVFIIVAITAVTLPIISYFCFSNKNFLTTISTNIIVLTIFWAVNIHFKSKDKQQQLLQQTMLDIKGLAENLLHQPTDAFLYKGDGKTISKLRLLSSKIDFFSSQVNDAKFKQINRNLRKALTEKQDYKYDAYNQLYSKMAEYVVAN